MKKITAILFSVMLIACFILALAVTALALDVTVKVSEVALTLAEPKSGATVSLDYASVEPKHFMTYKVVGVSWYKDHEQDHLGIGDADTYFKGGHKYTVRVDLAVKGANSGWNMDYIGTNTDYSGITATVNGKPAVVTHRELNPDSRTVSVMYTFDTLPDTEVTPGLFIPAPIAGNSPLSSEDIVVANSRAMMVASADYNWYVREDSAGSNSQWRLLNPTDKFEAGKDYRVSFSLITKEGFVFSFDSIHQLEGERYIFGYVNGKQASMKLTKLGVNDVNEDVYNNAKVSFNLDFTSCEAQELGSVSFSGVTAPTEGQHPIHNAPVMGGSYTLVTDDEVSGGAEYGFVDGVRWSTVLESLNAESVFEAGVRYSLSFFIKAGDIYRFSNWVEASSDVGYVSVETMLHDPTLAFVTIEFAPCSGGVLNEVNVGGVDAPANGAHPDYDFTLGQGYALDETNGVVWVDVTDNNKVMTPSDVFVYGHEYELFIVLCSDKAINGESGKFEFAPISSISAKINGENASRVAAHGDSPEAHCIELSQVYQCGKGIVGQVSATVTEPVEDSHPADRITVVGGMVGKYEFIDEDAGNSLKITDTFAADKNYYFTVTLTPEEGYTYALGVTKAFINGVEVSVIEADENKIVFGGYLYSSERNYYFVSFGAGEGASGHMDEVKVKDGMFTLPECEFEPALGMQFLAWSTDGTTAGAVYGTIEVNEGLSLTALWEDPEAHTHIYGSDYDGFNEFEHYKLCISPNCPDYGSEASKGEVMGHNWGNNTPCDSVCLDCGYERVNLGVVDGEEIPLHFYEFPCTEFCAVCGKFREVEHTPGPEANCMHPQICTVCGDPLHEANDNHTPGDAATCGKDQICTLCGEVVTPASGEHTPGQEADCTNPQTCTVCGKELAPAKGHEAGVEWLSDEGGHYKLCYCGDRVDEGEHIDEDGNELCDVCGYNMAGGLGVGAIVAIVVAGVVLVGGGGFCLFWFVFKKKK